MLDGVPMDARAVAVFTLVELRRAARRMAAMEKKLDAVLELLTREKPVMERLTESPMPAMVCSNCGEYMLPPRCAPCGWACPTDDDEDEPDADATDVFVPDPPGGESGS